jgi:hypothetical protein
VVKPKEVQEEVYKANSFTAKSELSSRAAVSASIETRMEALIERRDLLESRVERAAETLRRTSRVFQKNADLLLETRKEISETREERFRRNLKCRKCGRARPGLAKSVYSEEEDNRTKNHHNRSLSSATRSPASVDR